MSEQHLSPRRRTLEREVLLEQLRRALNGGDARSARRALTRSAALVRDTGDSSGGSTRGRRAAAVTLVALRVADAVFEPARVNGRPGLVLVSPSESVLGIVALDGGYGRIRELWVTLAPEKLESWRKRDLS